MLKLVAKDIHLNHSAHNKEKAINDIADSLVKEGFVDKGYDQGMHARENQSTTYLGNGIAIPHGTSATHTLIKKTGVQVFHFPDGVKWGDEGELAYIVIGIAARSDEHLSLLKQLTTILSDENIEERIKKIHSADDIIAILTGDLSSDADIIIDPSLLSLAAHADSLSMLQLINTMRLKNAGAVNGDFIADSINTLPIYLGQGIWLSNSAIGNIKNAVAISKPSNTIQEQDKPVNMLITVSSLKNALNATADKLAQLLFDRQVDTLINADATYLIDFFKSVSDPREINLLENAVDDNTISSNFIVQNVHGLHTRPSSTLVKLIKNFDCKVLVTNLNAANAQAVNAASLVKLISIGAKKGDNLRFTATGPDAEKVIAAIGNAMAEGLGEEIE